MVTNARIEWLFLRRCLSLFSPPHNKEWEERRKQNIEKMNEEMEKIAEYERNQRVSATGAPWRRGGAAGSGECSNTHPHPQPTPHALRKVCWSPTLCGTSWTIPGDAVGP